MKELTDKPDFLNFVNTIKANGLWFKRVLLCQLQDLTEDDIKVLALVFKDIAVSWCEFRETDEESKGPTKLKWREKRALKKSEAVKQGMLK